MNLAAARDLKRYVVEQVAPLRRPLAVGIRLTDPPGSYRVAILARSSADCQAFETREMRALFRAAGADLEVEIIGEVTRTSGGGDVADHETTLRIGASVGHYTGGDGSLGFFAVQSKTGRRGLVSCNHAIALADRGAEGDGVISPSYSNGGRFRRNVVATLDGSYPRLHGEAPRPADCAFAVLNDGVAYDASSVDGGTLVNVPAAVTEQLEVAKIGYVTNFRRGVITKIEVDHIPVRYGDVKAFFDNAIQIASTCSTPFAAPGDSGALVYTTRTFQPVGLLFAASVAGGPHNAGWAWVHPIEQVTRSLNVDFVVT